MPTGMEIEEAVRQVMRDEHADEMCESVRKLEELDARAKQRVVLAAEEALAWEGIVPL